MVKQAIFQFLNAGVFVIGVKLVNKDRDRIINDELCSQITLVMLTNSIIPNITNLFFNYSEIINRIYRLLSYR